MTGKNSQPEASAIVDDAATERLKERARDVGLIVNTGADPKRDAIASQTKTTRRLDQNVKQKADARMTDKGRGGEKK
jgi:hypothetical protein